MKQHVLGKDCLHLGLNLLICEMARLGRDYILLGRLNLERCILPHSILLYGSANSILAGRHTEALKSQIIPPRPGILTGLIANPTSPTTLMLRVASNLKIQVQ